MRWKKFLLLTCKILGLLVTTLAVKEKYPVLNRDTWTIPIQMHISIKQENFSEFFSAFWKSTWSFDFFEQKDGPHRFCIFEITHSENVAWWMSKKSHFQGYFDKEYGKRAQELLKSASKHLYHIHWSVSSQLSWKKSPLLTCQILGLLVKTLAGDDNYGVLNRHKLTIPIQMQLSTWKKFFFCQFSAAFTKSRLNFEYL